MTQSRKTHLATSRAQASAMGSGSTQPQPPQPLAELAIGYRTRTVHSQGDRGDSGSRSKTGGETRDSLSLEVWSMDNSPSNQMWPSWEPMVG
jgi:hypothetical protein